MQTYQCQCGNLLFFDNSVCLRCQREVGHCPVCDKIVTLLPAGDGAYRCGNEQCGAGLVKCINYSQHQVCNRCLAGAAAGLCDCCRFNHTIPDLSVPGNLERWGRLEAAKRRLFYDLNQLALPYGTVDDGIEPSLGFDFKADVVPEFGSEGWQSLPGAEKVYTGHADGLITINIREADTVEREKARVLLGENKRTLLGHFRHEIGHFYWEVLVRNRREEDFKRVFGDYENPIYADAMKRYYESGPAADWSQRYVSPYASMHPWEDFAETWATYLSMVSELDTAYHVGFGNAFDPSRDDATTMIARYQQLGVALNELNRSMGLSDAVPEIIVPAVAEKLSLIHQLVRAGRAENGALQSTAATTPTTAARR